jgi:hypothetical protein
MRPCIAKNKQPFKCPTRKLSPVGIHQPASDSQILGRFAEQVFASFGAADMSNASSGVFLLFLFYELT